MWFKDYSVNMASPPDFKHGLVGFFDILGFKNVAEAESDEDMVRIAELVSQNLVKVREIQKEIVREIMGPGSIDIVGSCAFADSILLWCEIPPAELFDIHYWLVFFRVCAQLMKHYFNEGLPLRGAISHGKFFIEDHCFFGKPFVESHVLAERTEWAGCVIEPGAEQKLEVVLSDAESAGYRCIMEQVCVRYGTPVKRAECVAPHAGEFPPLLVIKWTYYDLWRAPEVPSARKENCLRGRAQN
jgi:hypothetical protein